MLKVAAAVKTLLLTDDIALLALQNGYLNLSAYAQKIHLPIEEATMKAVKTGTIVSALARLADSIQSQPSLRPKVILDDLTTRSPLCDISFFKTEENRVKLIALYENLNVTENAFFTVTQSMSEITIIAPQSYAEAILSHFGSQPKAIFTDQVAVTVRFNQDYLEVPNILYTLQSALAVHHINCIEIVSTYTEFSFVIDKKYLEMTIRALDQFFI